MEKWKPVPYEPYSKYYKISDHGNVLSTRSGKLMHKQLCKNRHLYVNLSADGKRKNCKVNRLVALAFLGKCPKGYVCDHIDRDPLNNHISNLRYVTYRGNILNSDRMDDAVRVAFADATPRLKALWRSYIEINGKRIMIGSFYSREWAKWTANIFYKAILEQEQLA